MLGAVLPARKAPLAQFILMNKLCVEKGPTLFCDYVPTMRACAPLFEGATVYLGAIQAGNLIFQFLIAMAFLSR